MASARVPGGELQGNREVIPVRPLHLVEQVQEELGRCMHLEREKADGHTLLAGRDGALHPQGAAPTPGVLQAAAGAQPAPALRIEGLDLLGAQVVPRPGLFLLPSEEHAGAHSHAEGGGEGQRADAMRGQVVFQQAPELVLILQKVLLSQVLVDPARGEDGCGQAVLADQAQ